jgi:hypothetical protein
VRKLPWGRYQPRYLHGEIRPVAPDTFPTEADALAWLSRSEAEITRGAWVDPNAGKTTFAELAER